MPGIATNASVLLDSPSVGYSGGIPAACLQDDGPAGVAVERLEQSDMAKRKTAFVKRESEVAGPLISATDPHAGVIQSPGAKARTPVLERPPDEATAVETRRALGSPTIRGAEGLNGSIENFRHV